MAVRDDTPFSTHAWLRVTLSRNPEEYKKWIPRAPRNLPQLPASTLLSERASKLWQNIWNSRLEVPLQKLAALSHARGASSHVEALTIQEVKVVSEHMEASGACFICLKCDTVCGTCGDGNATLVDNQSQWSPALNLRATSCKAEVHHEMFFQDPEPAWLLAEQDEPEPEGELEEDVDDDGDTAGEPASSSSSHQVNQAYGPHGSGFCHRQTPYYDRPIETPGTYRCYHCARATMAPLRCFCRRLFHNGCIGDHLSNVSSAGAWTFQSCRAAMAEHINAGGLPVRPDRLQQRIEQEAQSAVPFVGILGRGPAPASSASSSHQTLHPRDAQGRPLLPLGRNRMFDPSSGSGRPSASSQQQPSGFRNPASGEPRGMPIVVSWGLSDAGQMSRSCPMMCMQCENQCGFAEGHSKPHWCGNCVTVANQPSGSHIEIPTPPQDIRQLSNQELLNQWQRGDRQRAAATETPLCSQACQVFEEEIGVCISCSCRAGHEGSHICDHCRRQHLRAHEGNAAPPSPAPMPPPPPPATTLGPLPEGVGVSEIIVPSWVTASGGHFERCNVECSFCFAGRRCNRISGHRSVPANVTAGVEPANPHASGIVHICDECDEWYTEMQETFQNLATDTNSTMGLASSSQSNVSVTSQAAQAQATENNDWRPLPLCFWQSRSEDSCAYCSSGQCIFHANHMQNFSLYEYDDAHWCGRCNLDGTPLEPGAPCATLQPIPRLPPAGPVATSHTECHNTCHWCPQRCRFSENDGMHNGEQLYHVHWCGQCQPPATNARMQCLFSCNRCVNRCVYHYTGPGWACPNNHNHWCGRCQQASTTSTTTSPGWWHELQPVTTSSTTPDPSTQQAMHPVVANVSQAVQEAAVSVTCKLQAWAQAYEAWVLELANVEENERKAYMGRTRPVEWILVDIADDRVGPVSDVLVDPSLSLAGRAAETGFKILSQILEDRSSQRWQKALQSLISTEHRSVESLKLAVGPQKYNEIFDILWDTLSWSLMRKDSPPQHALAKWGAVRNKVARASEA